MQDLIDCQIVGGLWFADHGETELVAKLKASGSRRLRIKLKRRGWHLQVSLPTIFAQFPTKLYFVFSNLTSSPKAVTLEQFWIVKGLLIVVDFSAFSVILGYNARFVVKIG
jgi:hypothetical protein